MTHRVLSLLTTALTALVAPAIARTDVPPRPPAPARMAQAARPNVIVILADDMGFSDVGSYGGEIATPHLDALAAGGIRFTQFYNSARCSPSRAALMTGIYPHEAGMGHLEGTAEPTSRGLRGRLSDRAVTIAQVLKPAGYFTGMAGKWHLGTAPETSPPARGFDRSITLPGGIYFRDQPTTRKAAIDGKRVPLTSLQVGPNGWYGTDLLVDWTSRFVREAGDRRQPFFLYLPFVAPHFPVMAPADEIARIKGRYRSGWDALRAARLARQKTLGLIDPRTKLPPLLDENYDWNRLSSADKERFDTMMTVYAAAITRMDRAIGRLVADLASRGELDNTLILFMSDNGGTAEGGPDGRTIGSPLGGATSTLMTGLNWATLQNAPFRYFKSFTHEGGIATPLIAHWPKGIATAMRGTLVRDPGHLIDVMPTVVALSGASYPARYGAHAILPMKGRSFAPAFTGQRLTRGEPIFWEHEGHRAIRDGQWKLVARRGMPWELYDMTVDRTETRDLAGADPVIVQRMAGQWDAWAARSFVDPWQGKENAGVFKGRLEGGGWRRRTLAGLALLVTAITALLAVLWWRRRTVAA
ncbi:MAG TPA: arylsulfatase [Sphingomonas sp.]|jgi:arylsulfatase